MTQEDWIVEKLEQAADELAAKDLEIDRLRKGLEHLSRGENYRGLNYIDGRTGPMHPAAFARSVLDGKEVP